MQKVKSHAKWNGLSEEQRSALEEWLFEEKLGYDQTLERAQKELGFKGSRSSLRRFYGRRAGERTLEGFAESGKLMASVNGARVDVTGLRNAGMKVAAQVFFRLVTEKPEELKAWLPLAKLLAQCEKNAGWRAVKDEENEIRRATLQFSRVRFQYDTMGEAMKALPELQELKAAQAEAEMTEYEKNKRLNDLRRRMFGDAIPELLPESEEEEAHPEIIERRFQAAVRKKNEQWAREYRERQREQAEREAKKRGNNSKAEKPETEGIITEGNKEADPAGDEKEEGVVSLDHKPVGQGEGGAPREAGRGQEPESRLKTETPAEAEAKKEPERKEVFVDEPRRLTAEERQRDYEELMRRARGAGGGRRDF